MIKRYDEKILNRLLDKYENSLLYTGKNQVNITISLPVKKGILPEYFDETSTQFDVIHEQLEALEEKGYVRLVWKNKKRGHILERCELVTGKAGEVYAFLRRMPRAGKEKEVKDICSTYKGRADVLDCFLGWVEERLEADESVRKYVDEEKPEEFARLCELIWRILTNKKESFLREFSVLYFHDSKLAEKEIEKAVSVIVRFSEGDALKGLDTAEVLEEHNIYKNPTLLILKGGGRFCMECRSTEDRPPEKSGNQDLAESVIDLRSVPGGIGIANSDINRIQWSREHKPKKILTIENLTSFHQWRQRESEDGFALCIYLGGYHNHTKRQFLKNLHQAYPQAEYYHFGDIDCGGFRIWKDLCEKTGIPFRTFHMDCDTYIQYLGWGRDLTQQDRKILLQMGEDPFFKEQKGLFALMLEAGKKIEQECVEA